MIETLFNQLIFFKIYRILLVIVIIFLLFIPTSQTNAQSCPSGYQCQGGCISVGQCVGNVRCIAINGANHTQIITPGTQPCGSAIVGGIIPPQGVARYNLVTMQSGGDIGIMLFISNALKLFAVVCGILVFGNLLYSGYLYITGAGNTETHTKVRERVTWSVLGLVLLIASYALIAMISLLLFNDAGFILNPDLTQYGALAP